jgi:hypothetical protein
MPVWGWGLIALAVVAVAALTFLRYRRSQGLRQRFGPEYERVVTQSGSRRNAEKELTNRERRREQLHIRQLDPAERDRYAARWRNLQADFVDSPPTAVAGADALVTEVMRERGYPMDDFDQRSADISVDHPVVVECYREAHRLSRLSANGEASTDDLRLAIRQYRRLFEELLEMPADEPMKRERDAVVDDSRAADAERTRR